MQALRYYLRKILYILPAKRSSLISLVLVFLLVSVLEVFGIGLINPFINLSGNLDLIEQHHWLHLAYTLSGVSEKSHFVALLGMFIIIILFLKSWISWKSQAYVFQFSYQQQSQLISKLMNAYLDVPYHFLLGKNSANIIQNIIDETKKFANGVLITLLMTVSNLIVAISLMILLCWTSIVAVLGMIGIALPLIFLFKRFQDRLVYWGRESSQANEAIIRTVNHGLGSIKETKILGCKTYFKDHIAIQATRYAHAQGGFYAFKLAPRVIIEAVLVMLLVGTISVLLIQNHDIRELIPVLSVFAIASIRLIPASSNFAGGLSLLRNTVYTVDKLYDDLKSMETATQESAYRASALTPYARNGRVLTFDHDIVLEALTYRYPNTAMAALDHISLTIHKGQSIALIGKSGSGKTTLVNVLLGLLMPATGDIRIDNHSIYTNLPAWQSLVGYIPQSIFLTDDTITRNIAFGVPDSHIDPERLTQAIAAAQLTELIDDLPDGLHTQVGERGIRLSGGQQQRIGIARALYHQKEVLILDEATAALDNETERLVTEAMKALSGVKTIVIVAHRLTTVAHCDHVYVMDHGRIVKSGLYQEIVA
jgi:ABC-type multidrug transport system fused ATPase/permease subunit